jgi:hypothetical protein
MFYFKLRVELLSYLYVQCLVLVYELLYTYSHV